MKTFIEFLLENDATKGGQDAGKLEVDKTSLEKAESFCKSCFKKEKLEEAIPDFKEKFKEAKKKVEVGKTQRKDMPVIGDDQVKMFQWSLERGMIDIKRPFAKDTDPKDPWPEGLSNKRAHQFMTAGIRDNDKKDDKIDVSLVKIPAKNLKPIQKQIYLDKSMEAVGKFGIKPSITFLKTSLMIKSSDNFIIDGHHRWFSSLMIDPNLKMKALSIDLPIVKLLAIAKAYGDSRGNKRNL